MHWGTGVRTRKAGLLRRTGARSHTFGLAIAVLALFFGLPIIGCEKKEAPPLRASRSQGHRRGAAGRSHLPGVGCPAERPG